MRQVLCFNVVFQLEFCRWLIELREIVEFNRVGLMPNRCSASSPEPPAREWRFQTRFGSTCNLWGSAQSLPQCSWQKGRVAPQARPTAALKNTLNSLNINPTKEHAQCGGSTFWVVPNIQISACLFKHHFYRGSHSKMASKEHCMCIKQKQNIASRSFCAALQLLSHLFNLYGSKEIVGKIQNDLVPIILVYLQWGAILPHSLWRNFQLKQSPLHCWKQPCGVQGLAIRFL